MYLVWDKKIINDFSDKNINSLYNAGYVFTRIDKGTMDKTRSIRIDLSKFELSSENRRILRKTENIDLKIADLPYSDYDWTIGKMAKDFYTTKFGDGTFSANKTKELLTTKHNFNKLFAYVIPTEAEGSLHNTVGYCICHETNELLHYCYPFYNIQYQTLPAVRQVSNIPNLGMSMMLHTILYAQKQGKKYFYLGSAKDEKAKYKLQFKGLEWFGGKEWKTNIDELKNILK